MLTNYARWYSFTPPQWPTLSPPLTTTLMTMAVIWSPFSVGSMARAKRLESHQERTQRSRGAKQRVTSSSVWQGTGPVAAVVEPLPEVLAQAVPVALGGEGRGHGVLAGAASENGPADSQRQAGQLWPGEVR